MKIPEAVIQEISRRASIVETVQDYLSLQKKGSRYWGLCPFHGEKTPSFSVTEEENLFYCFGCHKGGSIFTFLMEMEGLSFVEAVRRLAERTGVEVPETPGEYEHKQADDTLKELYEKLVKTFRYFLNNSDEGEIARRYLEERGIGSDIADTFHLGYAPPDRHWLYGFLRNKNYSDDFLATSGLFSKNYPEISLFHGRLIFPITNRRGETVAFGGRSLQEGGPKYINSPETPIYRKRETLYALSKVLPVIRKQKRVYLVEGYFDAIAVYQSGAGGAVAPLGTAFTKEQAWVLKRYVDELVLLFDGDGAGQEAARKSIPIAEEAGLDCSVVPLEAGNDPADIVKKESADSLKKKLKYSINSFEYLVKSALKESSRRPGGEREVVAALAPYLHTIDSNVKREGCIRYLSETLRIDPASIMADLRKIGERGKVSRDSSASKEVPENRVGAEKPIKINSELFLMLAVAANRTYFDELRSAIALDDLNDHHARELYIALEDLYRHGEQSLESLMGRIEEQQLKEILYEKIAKEEFTEHGKEIIHDGIRTIRRQRLLERRQRVEAEIRSAERKNTPLDELKELVGEKIYLDQELKKG